MIETEGLRASRFHEDEFREQQEKTTPLGRSAIPDEIALAAALLVGDAAHWVRGDRKVQVTSVTRLGRTDFRVVQEPKSSDRSDLNRNPKITGDVGESAADRRGSNQASRYFTKTTSFWASL